MFWMCADMQYVAFVHLCQGNSPFWAIRKIFYLFCRQRTGLTLHSWCLNRGSQKTECSVQSACPTHWPSYHSPDNTHESKHTQTHKKKITVSATCHSFKKEDESKLQEFLSDHIIFSLSLVLTPDTKVFPVSEGARSRDSTSAVCPWKLCSSCPLSTSHKAQVPSPLEVKIWKTQTYVH